MQCETVREFNSSFFSALHFEGELCVACYCFNIRRQENENISENASGIFLSGEMDLLPDLIHRRRKIGGTD